jgi:hypothetical protein
MIITCILLLLGIALSAYSCIYWERTIRIKNKWILAIVMSVVGVCSFGLGTASIFNPNILAFRLSDSQTTSSAISNDPSKPATSGNTSVKDKLADEVREKIGSKRFSNRDDYDYPYIIKFDPIDNNNSVSGAMTISHTPPPQAGDDASTIGKDCNYYFTYTIASNHIIAVFKSSDCGGKSGNMTFIYDVSTDNLYTLQSSGKKVIFTPLD